MVSRSRNPVIEMQLYVGNLGLNSGAAQNVNQLNTSQMQPYLLGRSGDPAADRADACTLPIDAKNGKPVDFTISFPSVTQYSLFQVNDDQGVLLVYTGSS